MRRATTPPRSATLALLALVALLLSGARGAGSDRPQVTEYDAKAAFLFKLAQYTTWPEETFKTADAPFVIGVLGKDPFGSKLEAQLKDKKVGTHPVRIERYEKPEKVLAAHVLFVAGSDPEKAAAAAKELMARPILLVGDCAGFAARGGIAGFYIEESKVHFEINASAAKRAHLVISPQVLKLARIVEEGR